nr:multiple inositol polyphosphate phosphatase 1-like [Penaeus vannamei]
MASVTRIIFLLMAAALLATLPPADGWDDPDSVDPEIPDRQYLLGADSDDESESTSGWDTNDFMDSDSEYASDYASDFEDSGQFFDDNGRGLNLEEFDENDQGHRFVEFNDEQNKSVVKIDEKNKVKCDDPLCANDDQEKSTKDYCLSEAENPYPGHATMTAYNMARTNNLTADKLAPEGCKPVQLWHLIRHGSRSMHRMDFMKMETQLPILKRKILAAHSLGSGSLCTEDLELIRAWKLEDMDLGRSGTLSDEGKAEIEGIATRYKAALPNLVYKWYSISKPSSENIRQQPGEGAKVAFAPSRQTYESAVTFLEALYGRRWGHVGLPVKGSQTLQYYDYCKNYINKVVALNKNRKPFHIFTQGKYLEAVMDRVSKRSGIQITLTKLRSMYNACRYQKAWHPQKTPPWCVVFTPNDLRVLEYWEDLRVYHDQGYAHPINYKQACILGQDVFLHFRNRIEKDITDTDSTTYFVNLEAFVPFLALLGLFKDAEPLTSDEVNMGREWKTSKFAGYGSNLGFLLSSCGNDSSSWWVTALLNEEKYHLPGCETSMGCPWDKFVSSFAFVEDCNFTHLCGRYSDKLWRSQHWRLSYVMHNWM